MSDKVTAIAEYKQQIAEHLATKQVQKAFAQVGIKQPTTTSRNAPAAIPSWLLTFFTTAFLPMLPALLGTLGAKITTNPKLLKVLELTYSVIGGLLGK